MNTHYIYPSVEKARRDRDFKELARLAKKARETKEMKKKIREQNFLIPFQERDRQANLHICPID